MFVPSAFGLLIYSLVVGDRHLTLVASGLGLLTVVGIFLQLLIGSRTRCPLCMTPVLVKKDCAKHRHSKSLLGSYRLPVALGVLLRGKFVCPYCHEPSVMEVRHHHSHEPPVMAMRHPRGHS